MPTTGPRGLMLYALLLTSAMNHAAPAATPARVATPKLDDLAVYLGPPMSVSDAGYDRWSVLLSGDVVRIASPAPGLEIGRGLVEIEMVGAGNPVHVDPKPEVATPPTPNRSRPIVKVPADDLLPFTKFAPPTRAKPWIAKSFDPECFAECTMRVTVRLWDGSAEIVVTSEQGQEDSRFVGRLLVHDMYFVIVSLEERRRVLYGTFNPLNGHVLSIGRGSPQRQELLIEGRTF